MTTLHFLAWGRRVDLYRRRRQGAHLAHASFFEMNDRRAPPNTQEANVPSTRTIYLQGERDLSRQSVHREWRDCSYVIVRTRPIYYSWSRGPPGRRRREGAAARAASLAAKRCSPLSLARALVPCLYSRVFEAIISKHRNWNASLERAESDEKMKEKFSFSRLKLERRNYIKM